MEQAERTVMFTPMELGELKDILEKEMMARSNHPTGKTAGNVKTQQRLLARITSMYNKVFAAYFTPTSTANFGPPQA